MKKIKFISKDTVGTKLFLSILFSTVCMTVLAQYQVRDAVAESPNTPAETLKELAKDSTYWPCWAVVRNSNIAYDADMVLPTQKSS